VLDTATFAPTLSSGRTTALADWLGLARRQGSRLAFVRHLLPQGSHHAPLPWRPRFGPSSVVLATDVFDQFVSANNLLDFALHCEDDAKLCAGFLEAPLSAALTEDLKAFLAEVQDPLAVRSSSLLEDSQYQPFTGVYEDFPCWATNSPIQKIACSG